jgi:hypothetical protein
VTPIAISLTWTLGTTTASAVRYRLSPTTPSDPSPVPETIAPFPRCEQPLGYPLGVAGGGSNPPVNRSFFQFGANDSSGPGNFTDFGLQGFLSTDPGHTESITSRNGVGGPYFDGYVFQFLYYPALDGPGIIYLEDALSNGSSQIGAGGSDLNNGNCIIHAGTSSEMQGAATGSRHNLLLKLDIEFLRSGTWYLYESVQNNLGFVNPSHLATDPWSYWGYWVVP